MFKLFKFGEVYLVFLGHVLDQLVLSVVGCGAVLALVGPIYKLVILI